MKENLIKDYFDYPRDMPPTHADERYQQHLADERYFEIKNSPQNKKEQEALNSVYRFIKLRWRIINHKSVIKSFLRNAFPKIPDKEGKTIWIKDADGKDLESFCQNEFPKFGLTFPEDYSQWTN